MKYIKKPIIVDAVRVGDENMPKWYKDKIADDTIVVNSRIVCYVTTPKGTMKANEGDYIILDPKGNVYPCKPDLFEAMYELIGD